MTLFLTWQSAELNSRPLTRRQSPLKERRIHRMAGGLSFKGKVITTHYWILPWLIPQSSQGFAGHWFSYTGLHSFSALFRFILHLHHGSTTSTFRFLFNINNLALAWSLFSKHSVRWSKTVSTCFYLTLRTSQSKALMLLLCFVVWIGVLFPETQ